MRKSKLIALAAGFFAAAGIATAGKVFIDGQDMGTYQDVQVNGNGTIQITTSTTSTTCVEDISNASGCQERTDFPQGLDDCSGSTDADLFSPGCQTEGGTNEGPTDPTTPSDCSGVPEAGTRGGNLTAFSNFPSPTGTKHNFTIESDKYMAVEFTAPAAGDAGYLATATDSFAVNGLHSMAISRCPGDFSQEIPEGVCRKESSSHSFWWSTFGEYYSSTCELVPGETYYLNVKYAKLDSLSVSECGAFQCGAKLAFVDY